MTTLTIEISEKAGKTISELVKQLGGKVISVRDDLEQAKSAKKAKILEDLKESAGFVKLHQAGKVEAKSIDNLLNEL